MAAKAAVQLEPVEIGYKDVETLANMLYERYDGSEKENITKFFLRLEISKKIEEALRKAKPIHMSLEEFTMQVEKRIGTRIIYREVKDRVNSKQG